MWVQMTWVMSSVSKPAARKSSRNDVWSSLNIGVGRGLSLPTQGSTTIFSSPDSMMRAWIRRMSRPSSDTKSGRSQGCSATSSSVTSGRSHRNFQCCSDSMIEVTVTSPMVQVGPIGMSASCVGCGERVPVTPNESFGDRFPVQFLLVSSHAFEPLTQHDWFQRVGRWFHTVTSTAAALDLPDKLSLPQNRPVILAANHRSLLDFPVAMALFSRFDVSVRIQIQAAYMQSGVGAKLFQSVGAIPTSRAHVANRPSATRSRRSRTGSCWRSCLKVGCIGRTSGSVAWATASRGSLVSRWPPGPSSFRSAVQERKRSGLVLGSPRLGWPRRPVRVRLGEPIELASTDHNDNAVQVMSAISDVLVEMGDEPTLRDVEASRI